MRHSRQLTAILARDPVRMGALRLLKRRHLADGWIGAGFVRDAVWDALHGFPLRPPVGDVDIVWHDAARTTAARDVLLTGWFARHEAKLCFSVKNQARMHSRNGDAPYLSVAAAMRHWPETATAVAVRLDDAGRVEVNAPFGLDDLFALRLLPTPRFTGEKRVVFAERVAAKDWLRRYPKLRIA